MEWMFAIPHLLLSGVGNLASYLAAHVLLCLLPAFYIAGAMTALIPKPVITRFLGRNRPRYISYPAAALAGSVLAVCSCTIVPLFAGIYKKGAGLGPAITFLFFAPAANVLALIYTGGILGPELAIARLVLSLLFGISIGMLMAAIFWRDDQAHDEQTDLLFAGQGRMQPAALAFLLLLIALLLCGTLKIDLLTTTYGTVSIPWGGLDQLQSLLAQLVPFDPRRGGEGLSAQGALLIMLLGLVGLASWQGIETIFEGWNRWTTGSLVLLGLTLVMAAVGIHPQAQQVELMITGRALGVLTAFLLLTWLLKYRLSAEQQCN